MIDFLQVHKSYGDQVILRSAGFRVNPGERVGIVGPNGTGKSTIFSLIMGELSPDGGTVIVPRDMRIGHVHQELNPQAANATLLEYSENPGREVLALEREIGAIEGNVAQLAGEARERALRRLGTLQTKLEAEGAYAVRSRTEAALSGLGFKTAEFADPFASFSGGWQMRAELARVLVSEPGILLLDEPSNYLDIPAVEWLQRYLRDYHGTLALISHDRYLLNSLTSTTLEVYGGEVTRYTGNYDRYVHERVRRQEVSAAAQKNLERRRDQMQRFIDKNRARKDKASQVKSMAKKLDRLDDVNTPAHLVSRGRIRLRPASRSGQEVVRLDGVGHTYDGEKWVFRDQELRIERGEKVALVGLNGMGKTTLLRIFAGVLDPAEGRRVLGHKVVVGYQAQEFAETMLPQHTVFETVKSVAGDASEQEVRTLLGGFGFPGDAVEKPVSVLSGGEKVRLGITAPPHIPVHRKEVYEAIQRENQAMAEASGDEPAHVESLAMKKKNHDPKS